MENERRKINNQNIEVKTKKVESDSLCPIWCSDAHLIADAIQTEEQCVAEEIDSQQKEIEIVEKQLMLEKHDIQYLCELFNDGYGSENETNKENS